VLACKRVVAFPSLALPARGVRQFYELARNFPHDTLRRPLFSRFFCIPSSVFFRSPLQRLLQ